MMVIAQMRMDCWILKQEPKSNMRLEIIFLQICLQILRKEIWEWLKFCSLPHAWVGVGFGVEHTNRTLGCVVDNSKFYRTKSSYRILLNHYKALVAEMFFTRKNSNSKFVWRNVFPCRKYLKFQICIMKPGALGKKNISLHFWPWNCQNWNSKSRASWQITGSTNTSSPVTF